jgi:hypothetical protein
MAKSGEKTLSFIITMMMLLKGDQRNQFGSMIFIARMEWTNDANVLSAC